MFARMGTRQKERKSEDTFYITAELEEDGEEDLVEDLAEGHLAAAVRLESFRNKKLKEIYLNSLHLISAAIFFM